MLADILEALACPACGQPLGLEGSEVRCSAGHSFDVAREGYVNLLLGSGGASTADTPDMVRARRAFLDAGHLGPLFEAVLGTALVAVPDRVLGVFLDAGAGTGHLLATLLDAAPNRYGVALDISKHAARVAARAHARIGAIVADVWGPLPLRSDSVALITSVFAPRNATEFARVLAPNGALLVVAPDARHLAELVGPLGLLDVDPRKHERLAAKLSPFFELAEITHTTFQIALSRAEAVIAASMGPSSAHTTAEQLETRADALEERLGVTVSADVMTYRPRAESADTA